MATSLRSKTCRRRKTSFFADELPEPVRDQVLEKYRDWNVHDEWWECVYDDAKAMGALLGIEIDGITFSGFGSQGDGASFTGTYACKPDAVEAIKAECNDEKLIAFAEELTQLQVTFTLEHAVSFECQIIRSNTGRYSHSNTMNVSDWGLEDLQGDREATYEKARAFRDVLRSFADWIYRSLESEYNYLSSDECILESLRANNLKFTSEGVRIERRSK